MTTTIRSRTPADHTPLLPGFDWKSLTCPQRLPRARHELAWRRPGSPDTPLPLYRPGPRPRLRCCRPLFHSLHTGLQHRGWLLHQSACPLPAVRDGRSPQHPGRLRPPLLGPRTGGAGNHLHPDDPWKPGSQHGSLLGADPVGALLLRHPGKQLGRAHSPAPGRLARPLPDGFPARLLRGLQGTGRRGAVDGLDPGRSSTGSRCCLRSRPPHSA